MVSLNFYILELLGARIILGQNNPCESCSLQTYWGSTETLSVVTDNIFAIWWDPKFDHKEDAYLLLEKLIAIREDLLNNLGMADPPNPSAGKVIIIQVGSIRKCSPALSSDLSPFCIDIADLFESYSIYHKTLISH